MIVVYPSEMNKISVLAAKTTIKPARNTATTIAAN